MDKQIKPESTVETVKKRYLFFGEKEVRGRCPIYEKLALQIAADLDLISLIATFPKNKRQPNLLLASWLEMLVWPSEKARLQRLQASIALAAEEDLHLETGDLHTLDLEKMISKAPQDATLVVFHSAVLSYTLETKQRDAFAERIRTLTDYWVSNESPVLFSSFGCDRINERPGSDFLLALNGKPVAWTDPHGASIIAVDHSTDVQAASP